LNAIGGFEAVADCLADDYALGEALGLTNSYRHFTLLKEINSSLWYVRNSAEIHRGGLNVHLRGYERQVFTDVHEVADTDGAHYARLTDHLRGAGTPDVVHALKRLDLQPLLDAFAGITNSGTLREMRELLVVSPGPTTATSSGTSKATSAATSAATTTSAAAPTPVSDAEREARWSRIVERYRTFLRVSAQYVDPPVAPDSALLAFERNGESLRRLARFAAGRSQLARRVATTLQSDAVWLIVALAILQPLDKLRPPTAELPLGRLLDEWMLPEEVARVVAATAGGERDEHSHRRVIEILADHLEWFTPKTTTVELVDTLLADERAALYLGVNRYD
ncbi:MAG: hypothetical protein WD079_04200, partial [Phycisphaeraceae bacterium]